jgi:nonsense-mediated mRNA decay protein 3
MDINEEEETNKKDDAEKRMQDEELFMQELEEDFEGRAQINVYKKKNEDLDAVIRANQNALANETDDEDDDENDEIPEIKLEELLDDMKLSDVEEEEEEEMEMEIH